MEGLKIDGDLTASQFRLNNDSVGIVKLKSTYNSVNGKVQWNVLSENEKYNFISNGYYNTKDSADAPLYSTTHFSNTKVVFVNAFLNNIFDSVEGYTSGDLVVKGKASAPQMLGKMLLKNGGLTVKYTNVRYTVDSALMNFTEDGIDFGRFVVKDKYQNTGTIHGFLYERGFKNMRYDFEMSTNKMLLLDTKAKDNPQFYGKAVGKANLSLKGPQEDMKMNIVAESADSSHIYIPTTSSRQSAEADFIIF